MPSYTTPGTYTYTVPAGVISVGITVQGGSGGAGVLENSGTITTPPAGGLGGLVTASIPVTGGQVLTIVVGSAGNAGNYYPPGSLNPGAAGYHSGGAGGGTSGQGASGAGAGSSAVLGAGPVLYAEAGGGGAGGSGYSVATTGGAGAGGNGGSSTGIGIAGSTSPTAGAWGTGGGGATQSADGAAGTGVPGSGVANGNPGSSGTGGNGTTCASMGVIVVAGGGGGGGFFGGGSGGSAYSNTGYGGGGGGGGGASWAGNGATSIVYSTAGAAGNGSVTVTPLNSAPNAPTLVSPVNGAYLDASGGLTCQAVYNSTDGTNQNAYAARLKSTGGYTYYNAGSNTMQGTIVWNSTSTVPGGTFSFTFPASALSNGTTYNWSAASQESAGIQGPFASDFTVNAQAPPTLVVTGPTGSIVVPSPVVTWTTTPPSGATQSAYRVVIYTAAQQGIAGFTPGASPSTWDSGTLTGAAQNITVGVPLPNLVTYYAYVQVTETGGLSSAWQFTTFTTAFDPCATATVTAAAGTDGTTGCPLVAVTVAGNNNLLSFDDASFEGAVGSWVGGTNTTATQSLAQFKDGTASMLLTPTGAGALVAALALDFYTTFYVPVAPNTSYLVQASFRAGTTARSCNVECDWYTAAGVLISPSVSANVTDSTSAWVVASETVTSPGTAAYARLLVNVAGVSGSSDVHYVDTVGLQPGAATGWARGGLVGTTNVVVTRSDGLYVRGASPVHPMAFPSGVSLLDSGVSANNLLNNVTMVVTGAPAGFAFGGAAQVGAAAGYLQGPAGSAAANGAITGTAFTFECQFTMGATSTTYQIVASRFSGTLPPTRYEWQMVVNPTTIPFPSGMYFTLNNTGGALGSSPSSSPLVPGVNYALAATWDGATVRTYINGVFVSSFACTSAFTPNAANALTLLGYTQSPQPFPSTPGTVIDEVRVSNVNRYPSYLADSGSGNNLAIEGTGTGILSVPSPSGAVFGQAVQFSASSGYSGAAGAGAAQGAIGGSAFTVDVTYTPSAADGAGGNWSVVGRWSAAGGSEWLIEMGGGSILYVFFQNSSSAQVQCAAITVVAGTTYQIEVCWDGANVKTFLNGTLSATTAFTSPKAPNAAAKLYVGIGLNQPVTGTIDEVGVYQVTRHVSSFSPYTTPLPTAGAGSNPLVYHFDCAYTPATAPFVKDANASLLYHLDDAETTEVVTINDYEVVPSVPYSYSAVTQSPSTGLVSSPASSGTVSINTSQWWELDPTNTPSAINAQPLSWNPIQVEQSSANPVLGQQVMSVISSTVLHQDFNATMVMFTANIYTAFQALLISQRTIFISSPFGPNDSGYFRIGPQSGGMSGGSGTTNKNTTLNPSTVAGPYREVAITAIAAARPLV